MPHDDQLAKFEVDNAAAHFNDADAQMGKVSDQARVGLLKYYDALTLYAAGAISLSTSLVAAFTDDKPEVLTGAQVFGVTNALWLYTAWIAFACTFVTALLSKKFDSYYIQASAHGSWLRARSRLASAQLNFAEAAADSLAIPGQTPADYISVTRSDVQKLTPATKIAAEKESRYYLTARVLRAISEFAAVVALICLVTFMIVALNAAT